MQYLDLSRLAAIETTAFRQAQPFPWCNPAGLLRPEAFDHLFEQLPTIDQMEPSFGESRSFGQKPHDRYKLEYREDLNVSDAWHEFINELQTARYRDFIKRLFGRGFLDFRFHWHYAPRGTSVSPHCDAVHKLGSHIFYFSPPEHWRAEWGGETVILDDGNQFPRESAPEFDEFPRQHVSESVGNYSLIFQRKTRSWHGVREIDCPDGFYRKVFIVVINDGARLKARRITRKIQRKIRAQRAGRGIRA